MPLWLLWLIPAYEAGVWSTLFGLQGRSRTKVRQVLIHGAAVRKTLPFVDGQLRKAAGTPTKYQALVARGLVGTVRWFANTRAIEYAVLLGVRARWPGHGHAIDSKVRLCL